MTLQNAVKFMSQLDGRDKFLKLVQYLSRFAMWHFQQGDPKSDVANRLKLLYKGASLHRKAFRVGKWVDEYTKLTVLLKKSAVQSLSLALTATVRVCMALFYFFDNVVWLSTLKVLKMDTGKFKKNAARYRFSAAAINIILETMKFQKLQRKMRVLESKAAPADEIEDVEESLHLTTVNLVKHCCDVTTFGNSLEIWKPFLGKNLTDGPMGVFGTTSAIAAGYLIWKKKIGGK